MPLRCVARGADLDAAWRALDENLVQFAFIKIPIGSGTFKRNKFVYVHYVGPKCGVVKRGKWNAELPKALELFGTSAGFQESDVAALSFDNVVSKLQHFFVADSGEFSLDALRREYQQRIAEEKAKMAKEAQGEEEDEAEASPIRARKLAAELGLEVPAVIKAVHEDMSPLNWCTFLAKPNPLQLFEGGSNGLFELMENLPDDQILFGLVRLAFGTGRFRRSKCVFFQWCGDKIGPVAKSKANILNQEMLKAVGPANASIQLMGSEDRTVEHVLASVEKYFVVDNINLPSTERPKLSKEEYLKALKEEQDAASEFYEEEPSASKRKPPAPTDFDIAETLRLIRESEGGLVWGVFQVA